MTIPIRVSILLICLASLVTLSSCLSKRKPAAPVLHSSTYKPSKKRKGSRILTDISDKINVVPHTGNLLDDYATLLDVDPKVLENEKLYLLIDEWMGTPYAFGGSTKRGIDCSGFASLIMAEIYGKSIPRISNEQAKVIKRKYEGQLKEGDLVFFSFGGSKINHVGVYLHNHKFAHASTAKGVIISNLRDPWYYKAFKRAGTVK